MFHNKPCDSWLRWQGAFERISALAQAIPMPC